METEKLKVEVGQPWYEDHMVFKTIIITDKQTEEKKNFMFRKEEDLGYGLPNLDMECINGLWNEQKNFNMYQVKKCAPYEAVLLGLIKGG